MHQNRASPFASDFYRRRGYRREFRNEGHFYPFSSQKKSRFASDFLHRGNRASWGLKKSRDFPGSGTNRRRSRRESRDFGALRWGQRKYQKTREGCGCASELLGNPGKHFFLKFRRVTIRVGHNPPRGSPRKFASQRALRGSLRGLCRVSPRVLRGLCGALRGSAGFSEVFRGSDPMLVTLANCWIFPEFSPNFEKKSTLWTNAVILGLFSGLEIYVCLTCTILGNGRNTFSRVLFRKRELTANSVSSLLHTNSRLRRQGRAPYGPMPVKPETFREL